MPGATLVCQKLVTLEPPSARVAPFESSEGISMNASSLPQTIVACACCAALIGAVFGAGCGSKTPSRDGTTTTIATTTVATTTSTVPPTTTTSSTTTIGVGVLDARIDIQNAPCVAPSTGQVSCTFTGAATTGGRTPYTFSWRFTNFANNEAGSCRPSRVLDRNGCPDIGLRH